MEEPEQVWDGVPYIINPRRMLGRNKYSELIHCCDCGLAHETKYQIVDKKFIKVTHWRKDTPTKKLRNKWGVKVVKVKNDASKKKNKEKN
jgi:hypothetical protein